MLLRSMTCALLGFDDMLNMKLIGWINIALVVCSRKEKISYYIVVNVACWCCVTVYNVVVCL